MNRSNFIVYLIIACISTHTVTRAIPLNADGSIKNLHEFKFNKYFRERLATGTSAICFALLTTFLLKQRAGEAKQLSTLDDSFSAKASPIIALFIPAGCAITSIVYFNKFTNMEQEFGQSLINAFKK